MTAIETTNLTKTYRNGRKAVDSLNLQVKEQTVYGFLGLNGAGKTTTIRMILGLTSPTSGNIHVLGKNVTTSGADSASVGALVENATFYDFLTGRQNLDILALTSMLGNQTRINHVLEIVGATCSHHSGTSRPAHALITC